MSAAPVGYQPVATLDEVVRGEFVTRVYQHLLVAVGAFTFSVSFGVLWVMKKTFGIRTDPEAETAGLDVSEHGMWGYPEFYIPVPGGYGTEAHGHLATTYAVRGEAAATAHAAVALPEPAQ